MRSRGVRWAFGLVGMLLCLSGGFYLVPLITAAMGWPDGIGTLVGGMAVAGVLGLGLGYLVAPLLVAVFLVLVRGLESVLHRTPLSDLVVGVLGVVLGLIIANLLRPAFAAVPLVGSFIPTLGFMLLGYLGYLVAVRKKDDIVAVFSAIPRVRSAQKGSRNRTMILDTSAIIDGRVADIQRAGFLEGPVLVPRFVLEELRHVADSDDAVRRNRGRRGLDVLKQMQEELGTVEITDRDPAGQVDVDAKLIRLARELDASIVTTDFNLNRVAQLQGVPVLNINELSNAVKPPVLPGEELSLSIIREGKESGQGVGYLDDGTMVVVENAKERVGQLVSTTVTSVLQTSAGRMVFARPAGDKSHRS